jgi:diguanylate cyclase (GGDEF)-like protein
VAVSPVPGFRFNNKSEVIPARSRMLVPAAVVCGLLWLGAIYSAGREITGPILVPLGVLGLLATLVLLLLIQHQHARLRRLAATDALTGLVNHRGFHECLAAELGRAGESGRPLALVAIDLDNFKPINDTHGHPYGDRILRAVGAALSDSVRSTDIAARVGGEEFALILPGTDAETSFAVAERAREKIAEIEVEGFDLSCSAGIAAFPKDAEEPSALCQLADSALYWAKRGGKRRTRRFDPEHSPATWTESQRAEIEALLERDVPVVCVFQPVVNLASGRIVGYEALARFAGSGHRSPDVWFAQAHGCGLGAELEAAAIRAALEPAGRPPDTHLAINVSPSALSADAVKRALTGDLTGIVIEITEHEFVPDDDSLAATVASLRARGARIAIDDAGAGHAGLKQLMRVRPDIVKLDRALISDIHDDPARMALVESFVRFARDVGATVCAEGIESLDELAMTADLDVQWGQGFRLARPAPPWSEISAEAGELCRAALAESFRTMPAEHSPFGSSDRRLVHLSAKLAGARTRHDLESALALIAAELGASKICLSTWHGGDCTVEVIAENGERSNETLFAVDDYPLTAHVLREQEAVQVMVGDPAADPDEVDLLIRLGQRSLLMIPVVCRGETLGLIESYRADERPWSRVEINRARVIANQFASVIATLNDVAATQARVVELPTAKASGGRETRV